MYVSLCLGVLGSEPCIMLLKVSGLVRSIRDDIPTFLISWCIMTPGRRRAPMASVKNRVRQDGRTRAERKQGTRDRIKRVSKGGCHYYLRCPARTGSLGSCRILREAVVVQGGCLDNGFNKPDKYSSRGRTVALPHLTRNGTKFFAINLKQTEWCRLLRGQCARDRPLHQKRLWRLWRSELLRTPPARVVTLSLPAVPGAPETRSFRSLPSRAPNTFTMEATIANLNWLAQYINGDDDIVSRGGSLSEGIADSSAEEDVSAESVGFDARCDSSNERASMQTASESEDVDPRGDSSKEIAEHMSKATLSAPVREMRQLSLFDMLGPRR